MKNSALLLLLIAILALAFILPMSSQANKPALIKQDQNQNAEASCLAEGKAKPDVITRLGILNGKTLKMPRPKYPTEARRKSISGEVKTEVVIDLSTGAIVWADIQSGDPLLQEAVKQVICQARFYPTNDLDGRASGFLVYRFRLPRKSE